MQADTAERRQKTDQQSPKYSHKSERQVGRSVGGKQVNFTYDIRNECSDSGDLYRPYRKPNEFNRHHLPPGEPVRGYQVNNDSG